MVYGAISLKPGMKFVNLILRSSYHYQFSMWEEKYFGQVLPIAMVVDKPINYMGPGQSLFVLVRNFDANTF